MHMVLYSFFVLELLGSPFLTATLRSLLRKPGAVMISWSVTPDSKKIVLFFPLPSLDLSEMNSILRKQ